MSTFAGKIEEIPGISIDKFDKFNFDSEVYFLSHCHTDHMVGLDTLSFQNNILEANNFIYTSPISKVIINKLYPKITNQIKELDFFTKTSIDLKNETISVIPIPSGHCPGSVMFLFELNDKNILYTGDYRIKFKDLKKIKAFYDSYGELKNIYKIYLDTTFFFKNYKEFPTREESIIEICNLIRDWLKNDENYIINIKTSAKYGYEYVFMEIFNNLKMPVHVSEDSFKFYSLIPEMDKAVTLNGSETKIHSSCGKNFTKICIDYNSDYHIKTIKMSAMRWTKQDLDKGITSIDGEYGTHFVCYSTHASYDEGVDLIKFLKPKLIEPCVLSENDDKNEEMLNTINVLLGTKRSHVENVPKLFDIDKIIKEKPNKQDEDTKVDENDEFLESLFDSPPRKLAHY